MSRKRSHYRPRMVSTPMLIERGLRETEIDTQEIVAVKAFEGGWATTEHFDYLVDMRNILTLATTHKADKSAITICEAMRIPFANLRARHERTGRFGLTGDELQLVRVFVDFYRDFWLRQPVVLYEQSRDALARHNQSLQGAAS